jgi:hypothetical protein
MWFQVPGTATDRPLKENPRVGLAERYVPREAQAKGRRHDEKFQDHGGSHQGQVARRKLDGKGMTPFTREEAVMMIYGGHPPEQRRMSNL